MTAVSHRGAEVVVGVDGTPTALRAVSWAAEEAELRGVPLRIVHGAPYATGAAGRAHAAAILGRARTVARQQRPRVGAQCVRSDEPAVRALVEASRTAELLVVGRLSGHPGDNTVPSAAPAVVAGAHCPVTVVRANHDGAHRDAPVLLGVKDVAGDAGAVEVAFADARRHHGTLLVRHLTGTAEQQHAAGGLHDALRPWRERYPDVAVDVQVGHGNPGVDLVGRSVTARLVVVGDRRRGAVTAAVLGSTSRTLLRHSGCPVTVVPRGADNTHGVGGRADAGGGRG